MAEYNDIESRVIPNVLIIKTPNNEFTAIKFTQDGEDINYSLTTVDVDYMVRENVFVDMTMNDVIFAKLNYDFSFDDSEGFMELSLSGTGTYDFNIYEMIDSDIETLFNIYIDYLGRITGL